MVHRDIKPENLMFTDNLLNSIKVIDFGSAAIVEEKRTEFKAIGTVIFFYFILFFNFSIKFNFKKKNNKNFSLITYALKCCK